MKTLALSDFHWNSDSRDITMQDTLEMTISEILIHPNFSKVKFYFEIVTSHSPDLLLLCGDITGDGICGHGYTSSLTAFMRLVEFHKIQTRYISGNHDEPQFYDEIKRQFSKSKYIKELTGTVEKIGETNILGLSWEQTQTRSSIQKFLTSEKVDIVVCHCDHGQRLNLFDFNTDFIITGHYDLKVINPNQKTFISLDNDAPQGTNFVTLVSYPEQTEVDFYLLKARAKKWACFKFQKTKDSFKMEGSNYIFGNFPLLDNLSYLNNAQFEKAIEYIQNKKHTNQTISSVEMDELLRVKINCHMKISKSFIGSYFKTK